MKITAEMRARMLADSPPRWQVKSTRDQNWMVLCGSISVAVFTHWADALTFARWKATA